MGNWSLFNITGRLSTCVAAVAFYKLNFIYLANKKTEIDAPYKAESLRFLFMFNDRQMRDLSGRFYT